MRCFSMLGTVEGHDALSLGHHNGYKHYTKEEMRESAKRCSLCRVLSSDYNPPTCYISFAQHNIKIVRPGERSFVFNSIHGHHQEKLDGHRLLELAAFTTESI
jgi:hypothetical protein